MYQTETETTTETELSTYTGRVKWFNSKAGYGFITVCDGQHSGKDIFVHYSVISSSNPQYKYLVQGEYVDFSITKPENSDHEYHATNVGGVKGGNLMCETRREVYASNNARKTSEPVTDRAAASTTAEPFRKRTPRAYTESRPVKTASSTQPVRSTGRNLHTKTTYSSANDGNLSYQSRNVEIQIPVVSSKTGKVVGFRREKTSVFCPVVDTL